MVDKRETFAKKPDEGLLNAAKEALRRIRNEKPENLILTLNKG